MAGNAPRTDPQALLRLLLDDQIDAAIDAGLMDYAPAPGDDAPDPARPDLPLHLLAAQARLRTAWASSPAIDPGDWPGLFAALLEPESIRPAFASRNHSPGSSISSRKFSTR